MIAAMMVAHLIWPWYNIKIKTLLELGDDAGRLSITTVFCSDDVGGVHIQFHGGAR